MKMYQIKAFAAMLFGPLIMFAVSTMFLGCGEQIHDGFITEKEYTYCEGNPHLEGKIMYCNQWKLDCVVTYAKYVNGELVTGHNKFDAMICPYLEINDYVTGY